MHIFFAKIEREREKQVGKKKMRWTASVAKLVSPFVSFGPFGATTTSFVVI
jgi:hypothetical protein